jgi:hypothetical protein
LGSGGARLPKRLSRRISDHSGQFNLYTDEDKPPGSELALPFDALLDATRVDRWY